VAGADERRPENSLNNPLSGTPPRCGERLLARFTAPAGEGPPI